MYILWIITVLAVTSHSITMQLYINVCHNDLNRPDHQLQRDLVHWHEIPLPLPSHYSYSTLCTKQILIKIWNISVIQTCQSTSIDCFIWKTVYSQSAYYYHIIIFLKHVIAPGHSILQRLTYHINKVNGMSNQLRCLLSNYYYYCYYY